MTAPCGYRFTPDDLLFFRDGKPSTRGSDHYLASLFPPLPSTLYGAVRTRKLLDAGLPLNDLNETNWGERLTASLQGELGAWGRFGTLRLRGPWLVRDKKDLLSPEPADLEAEGSKEEVLFPAPADLGLRVRRSRNSRDASPEVESVVRFRLDDAGTCSWSHPLLPWRPYEHVRAQWNSVDPESVASVAGDWWLTASGLMAWSAGEVPSASDFVHRDALWQTEHRTGVGLMSGSRQAEEHLLYTFGFVRLQRGVSLGFDLQGIDLEPEGGIRVGGEGRAGTLRPGPAFPASPTGQQPAGRVVVTCLTPMLSTGGAYPAGSANNGLGFRLGGYDCKLVGAMVRGVLPAGGWDLARRRAKPLRRAIPAGSVFVFDSLPERAASALWGTSHSDFAEEGASQQGFGLVASGACPI